MKSVSNLVRLLLSVALVFGASSAMAQGSEPVTASEKISFGTMSIVVAPAVSVGKGGSDSISNGASVAGMGSAYVVTGLAQGVGDTVEILLSAVGATGKLSIKLSGKALDAIGVSVGQTVQVLSEATGTLLLASGKVLAFIPSELGQALLNQSRLPAN